MDCHGESHPLVGQADVIQITKSRRHYNSPRNFARMHYWTGMRTAFAGAQRYAFFGVREETGVNDAQNAKKSR
jgi:hypothetical protein